MLKQAFLSFDKIAAPIISHFLFLFLLWLHMRFLTA